MQNVACGHHHVLYNAMSAIFGTKENMLCTHQGLSFTSSIFQIQGFCFAWFMLVWPSRSYSTASFCTPAAILYIFCPSYKYIIICDCCTCYSVFPPYWGVLARIINEKALSSFVSLYLEGVTECLRIYSL